MRPFDGGGSSRPGPLAATWCVVALLAAVSAAQADPPGVYAIRGAEIVPEPGRRIASGTIVVRDGLIEAVGADVEIPADAVEIDGEALFVYPGLIEPLSDLGAGGGPASRGPGAGGAGGSPFGGRPSAAPDPGARHPLDLVQPERRMRDRLLPFEGDRRRDMERLRNLGFTVAASVPDEGIFRGAGAVLLLQDDVPVRTMLLREPSAQHVGFDRAGFGQGYPTSLMGAVATIRQVMLDATRHAEWTRRHAASPRGMRRPDAAPAFDALLPVIRREQRVVFHAESAADARLAARLIREFDLDGVIAGSGGEWEIVSSFESGGLPFIVPLAFPDKPKVDDADEALDVSRREMRRFLEARRTAAALRARGIRVALTTSGLKNLGDFRKNLRAVIDGGLTEDDALAALTTVPASLLGIEAVAGTLAPGKVANLAVYDGPIFAEKSACKQVFVDGRRYEIKSKAKPKGDPDAVVDPRGEWSVSFEFGSRSVTRTWTVTGERDAWSGTAETREGTVSFDSVTLEGNVMTVVLPGQGGRPPTEISVVIEGDSFEGSVEAGARSFPVKGSRVAGPGGGGR